MPYKGRIFVLIDRQCGSSGESAADMLREGLGATLVGERTAGLQEYGNVRLLALPRTLLVVHFATKRNYFTRRGKRSARQPTCTCRQTCCRSQWKS